MAAPKLRALVDEARRYSFDFLGWEKEHMLKQHWRAHAKTICPRCHSPFGKAHRGSSNRRSFFCALPEARRVSLSINSVDVALRTFPLPVVKDVKAYYNRFACILIRRNFRQYDDPFVALH